MSSNSAIVALAIKRTADTLAGKALPSAAGDIISWIESEFYIPETGGAMTLAPYQAAVLREAQRRGADGKFVYDFVLWSDIKKSAKSTIAAAVVLYRALHTAWGSFKIVANDLKQADSRVFYYIRRAMELNPRLGVRATIRNYKIVFDNKSVIEAIPVDPSGEAGGNDDMIEYTELHAFSGKAALKLWTETTISPTKHGYSQRWADTYAGMTGESPILEPIYEQLVQPVNRLDLGIPDLEVYAKGKILCLWNTTPRLPWQTADYYASEAVTLQPNEFQRVHRNQWTSSVSAFVPPEWWDACYAPMLTFAANVPVVVGMDAGVSNDCFALVGVSRVDNVSYVRFARIFKPEGRPLDFDAIEQIIRTDLAARFNIVQVAYDPYQLHQMATRLRRDGVAWLKPFAQGQDRLVADKQLYDAIRDRLIRHDGDALLSEHIRNANAQTNKEDSTLRLVKRAEHLKIDGAVALSMAHHEVRRLNL